MGQTLREIFVDNLKYYRQKKKMSQLTLATELEKSANYINGIENNNTFPSIDMIEKISAVLEISADKLFAVRTENQKREIVDKEKFSKELSEQIGLRLTADIACVLDQILGKSNLMFVNTE